MSLLRTLAAPFRLERREALGLLRVMKDMVSDKLARRTIVIVFVEEPGFIQFLLPVWRELSRQAGSRVSFYLATEFAERDDHLSVFEVPRVRRFHPRLARALILADVFLSASVYGRGPSGSCRINISHNQPTKFESYPRENLMNYDVHFLTGPLHRDQYEHMFSIHGLDARDYRLMNVGYPKSDALLRGEYDREKVLAGLGLSPSRKTVLYAPAWDPGGSLRTAGEEIVEQLLGVEDINVLVKLHPVSHTPDTSPNYDFYAGGVDWTARFRRFESNERFRHITGFQVDPLLVASDVLVTDFSSVALEFVGLDRPVLFVDCPEYFEKTLRLPGYNSDPEYVKNNPRANAGRHVGTVVHRVEELSGAVSHALANPLENSAKRRELAGMLLYNPGRGAETAARTILELVGLEPQGSPQR